MKAKLLLIALCAGLLVHAFDSETAKYHDLAKQFEVPLRNITPKWAARKTKPLFRIAWLTDQHIQNPTSLKMTRDAFKYIREVVKPDAVAITGDNIGYSYNKKRYDKPELKRQQDFQTILKDGLGDLPVWVIPGDNWPKAFDQVFGATHYAFDFGGFHFIFNTVDVTGEKNGCSRFYETTWQWLKDDLAAHATQPVVYFQHEPCLPPSFLDATALAKLFDDTPQLVLAAAGHLHLDLDFPSGHWSQWVGPSVGRSHRPGFKVLSFYPDQILANSIEWDNASSNFKQVSKFQRVKIPQGLRGGLHTPQPGEGRVNYTELPPGPREQNDRLDELEPDVMKEVKAFGLRYALKHFILD